MLVVLLLANIIILSIGNPSNFQKTFDSPVTVHFKIKLDNF